MEKDKTLCRKMHSYVFSRIGLAKGWKKTIFYVQSCIVMHIVYGRLTIFVHRHFQFAFIYFSPCNRCFLKFQALVLIHRFFSVSLIIFFFLWHSSSAGYSSSTLKVRCDLKKLFFSNIFIYFSKWNVFFSLC